MKPESAGGAGEPPRPESLIGAGIELALAVVLFMWAGFKLDAWLDTRPWLALIGALLGIGVGFYGFFRRAMPRGGRGR